MIITGIDCKNCTYYKKLQELEKENEVLKEKLERQRDYTVAYKNFKYEEEQKCRKALEEIQRVINLAHKVEDYYLGQDYTDLVDRIDKTLGEVLNG